MDSKGQEKGLNVFSWVLFHVPGMEVTTRGLKLPMEIITIPISLLKYVLMSFLSSWWKLCQATTKIIKLPTLNSYESFVKYMCFSTETYNNMPQNIHMNKICLPKIGQEIIEHNICLLHEHIQYFNLFVLYYSQEIFM